MTRKIKKGDRVKIHKKSIYFGQSKVKGRVLDNPNSDGWMHVRFDDGYSNTYQQEDLKLLNETPK